MNQKNGRGGELNHRSLETTFHRGGQNWFGVHSKLGFGRNILDISDPGVGPFPEKGEKLGGGKKPIDDNGQKK